MGEVRDLGHLATVTGEAIGQPGQRRFRLCMLSRDNVSAACWMEKEQLAALGEAIENALKEHGFQYSPVPLDDAPEPPVFPLTADVDFRVGRLSIGLDPGREVIVVTAGDTNPDDDEAMEVRGILEYAQGHELAVQIKEVVAAGRQPCPLCTAPMDPGGHVCVKRNGHHPH